MGFDIRSLLSKNATVSLSKLRLSKRFRHLLTTVLLTFYIIIQNFLLFVTPVYAASSPWSQTNWVGGSGQTTYSDVTKFNTSSNVVFSTPNQIKLGGVEKLTNTTFDSDISGWSTGSYALYDQYTTQRDAGSVNGTPAEPGPGTRTVIDTNSKITITAGGVLSFATGAAVNDGVYYASQPRTSGLTLIANITPADTNGGASIGWSTGTSGVMTESLNLLSSGILGIYINGVSVSNVGAYTAGTTYQIASMMRANGLAWYIKGGSYTNWTLLWVSNTGNSNERPWIQAQSTTAVFTVDNIRVYTLKDTPVNLLAYDTFNRTDGALGNTETTGPDSQTVTQKTWTFDTATWTVSGNKAKNSPTLGSELITNGDMETGSPPTGWSTSNCTYTSDAAVYNSPTHSSKCVSTTSASNIRKNITLGLGNWYLYNSWVQSNGTNGLSSQLVMQNNPWTKIVDRSTSAGTFTNLLGTGHTINTAGNEQTTYQVGLFSATNGHTYYYDDVSLKQMSLTSLFATSSYTTPDVNIEILPTVTAYTQAGIVLNLDSTSNPQNFVIVYNDGVSRTKLEKVVDGHYTTLINYASGYVAERKLRVIKNGTTYNVYYNDSFIGSATVSDSSIINNTNHGLFSTYSENTLDGFINWPVHAAPQEEPTISQDATTKLNGAGSAKVIAAEGNGVFGQSVNVGDTSTYTLNASVYTTGSAVTDSDAELYYSGGTVTTSYALIRDGWYLLTGTLTGANATRDYGLKIKGGKTVYVDDISLYKAYASSGTLTSSIFDTEQATTWNNLTYTAGTPANTTTSVRVRTSNNSDMSDAPAFSGCDPISSGSDISSNNCVTDGHRYLQYYVTLASSDGVNTPNLSSFSLDFQSSTPQPPTSFSGDSADSDSITWSWIDNASNEDGFYVKDLSNNTVCTVSSPSSGTGNEVNCEESSLTANTSYTRRVVAYNSYGNSSPSSNATYTTLSTAPTLSNITIEHTLPNTYVVTNGAGFGAGAIQYLRWAWDNSATHVWNESETQWTSGTLTLTTGTDSSIPYYLHVKSYNSADVANDTLDLGPYYYTPALSSLSPSYRLLSSDTSSATLSLTTWANANCRYSESPDTPYASMTNNFTTGQGTTAHSTSISNWNTITTRTFYVRCDDTPATGRSADSMEVTTQLRKMGTFDAGYPRLYNQWGSYGGSYQNDYFAGYNTWISWSSNATAQSRANAIRAINSKAKVLMTQDLTYGQAGSYLAHNVYSTWLNASPGDPGYPCMFRNTSGTILTNGTYGNPMYNLTNAYCVTQLVNQAVDNWEETNLAFDGWFWDMVGTTITNTIGPDIDSDLDGVADNTATLNAAYQAGVESALAQIRAAIPNAIIIGNGSPISYGTWENGRFLENDVRNYIDDYYPSPWIDTVNYYKNWISNGEQTPVIVDLNTNSLAAIASKYGPGVTNMPTAMINEAGSDYKRLRFGLVTALMGNGVFSYDLSPYSYGHNYWYDEYGTQGDYTTTGYLGQPTADAALAIPTLSSTDDIANGDFSSGTSNWSLEAAGAGVSVNPLSIDATGGISGGPGAHISIPAGNPAGDGSHYIVFYQNNLTIEVDKYYTLSFWAKANPARTLSGTRVQRQVNPWEYDTAFDSDLKYGRANLTTEWQHFYLIMKGTVNNSNQGRLTIDLGTSEGDIYFDDIKFQEGTIGVWTRPFDNGRVLVNITPEEKTIDLTSIFGTNYVKLNGNQAPLYYTRVDDDDSTTVVSGGWTNTASTSTSYPNQFGSTFKTITGSNPAATVTYNPVIEYDGNYVVYAWVAPSGSNRANVSVTINHAGSTDTTTLNETTGSVGWHELGTYNFTTTDTSSVVFSGAGTTGTVVADAVRLETTTRYNDGSEVGSITLESEDAIILLNDETAPTLTSVTISDSSGYTNDSTPTININSSGSPTHVAFSCNGGTNWSSWIAYSDTISSFDVTNGATGCTSSDGSKAITAKLKDLAGNESSTASDSTVYDTTAPTGGSMTYTDGYYTIASVSLTVADGSDGTGSGVNTSSRIIQRRSAPLILGICTIYGSFSAISPSGSYPNLIDTDVSSGNCYQYRHLVSDNLSQQATYTGANTVKVDTGAPSTPGTPLPTPASPTNQTSQTWTWSAATDAVSGVLQYAWRTTGSAITSGTTALTNVVTNLAEGIYNFFVKAIDLAGNESEESEGTLTVDTTNPDVTINQAVGQSDPTNVSPINFTVEFSESVSDFTTGDVTLGGTAGATTATVTGSGTTYNVAVSGMTGSGTVTVSVAADKAHDAAGNPNNASTTSDNSVTWNVTGPALTSIAITDTGGYTNDSTPSIAITQTGTPTHAAFSCNGGTNWSAWMAYSDTISSFDITTGATGCSIINGAKTISAKLKDALGNESGIVSDSTNFDTTGPTGTIIQATDPTNDNTPSLALTIADAGVGVTGAQMRFSCDNATWTAWEAYATPKTDFDIKPGAAAYGCGTTEGSRTVYVQYRDSLTNQGSSYNTGAFTLDTTAPTTPGTPSTASLTTDNTPTWSWTASTDTGSGLSTSPYSVQWCSNSGFTGCDSNTDTSTTNSYTHSTALADGTWYFRVKSADLAENSSAYSSSGTDTINTVTINANSSDSSSSSNSSASAPSCDKTAPGSTPLLWGATARGTDSILLQFGSASDPVEHYALEFGTEPGKYIWGATTIGDKGTREYLVKSLSPNTRYYFRIRAGNGCAAGNWSQEISAKTWGYVSANNLEITNSELTSIAEEKSTQANSCQTYTVKSGDSLWSIAQEKLGDGNKYKEIIEQNKGKYPSLGSSNNLNSGWELKINCNNSQEDQEKSTEIIDKAEGYKVKVKVSDTKGDAVVGAKVTMHSKVQETTTDGDGIAEFYNVEPGDHRVIIAYGRFVGEQSINLEGDVKEFALNVTVQEKPLSISPLSYGIIGILTFVIVILVVIVVKLKKKNK